MRLEVYLNARGERRFVGLLEERGGDILFEYDKRFLDSGIELSPFLLPLRPGVASDPKRTFDGLFGVFNDSLPDGWGLLLLDRLLRRSGLPLERITPLSRLSLVGSGGMGALEYEPVTPDPDPLPERIDLDGVAEEAWRTLNEDPLPVETLRTLMALNGSSCGARLQTGCAPGVRGTGRRTRPCGAGRTRFPRTRPARCPRSFQSAGAWTG